MLQQLSRGRYSLVLMDCMMPRLDGYATTKMIRESCPIPNSDASISSTASAGPGAGAATDAEDTLRPLPQTGRRGSNAGLGASGRRQSLSLATIPRGIPVVAMTGTPPLLPSPLHPFILFRYLFHSLLAFAFSLVNLSTLLTYSCSERYAW